ncbi:hypothetical protein AX15_001644 [Amanita polypyramis BW_CC]|nr:hypothetical protein AX15_001644 [Amanita polypyramis BW_CC]
MDAKEPFNSPAKADAILRSSNKVDFFIIKLLLSLVSPFFNDMFSSTHITPDETRGGIPIIHIDEDSATLHCLLLLVYPPYVRVDEPVLHIDTFHGVARAAQKYGMDYIENELKKIALSSQFLSENAFRVCVSAIHLGWMDVATAAAQKTLGTSLCDLPFVDELSIISGAYFYSYLIYRIKCEEHTGEGDPPQLILTDKTISAVAGDQLLAAVVTTADAPSPFGPSTKADAVLRSSDGVDFYVTKSFLAFLSPIFDTLFENSNDVLREIDGIGQELSVFSVKEDSATLFGLLCFLYPNADEPGFKHFETFRKIWVAAQKYEIPFVAQKLERSLLSSSYIREEPLRVFAVGVGLRRKKVIDVAAMNTLAKPLTDLGCAEELHSITGASLYRLMEYRSKCAEIACHLLDSTNTYELLEHGNFTNNPQAGYYTVHPVFTQFSGLVRQRLRECPRGSSVVDDDLVASALEKYSRKGYCEPWVRKLLSARRVLALAVDLGVSKISVNIDY